MALRSFAILSVLITTVFAQSQNPLIPSGISQSCTTYLTSLDALSSFSSCTNPILSALTEYSPSGSASSSLSNINTALNNLCGTTLTAQCPDNILGGQLAQFYAACPNELTSDPNNDVKRIYDVLYTLGGLRKAICTKDTSGNYCAAQLGTSKTGGVAAVEQGSSRETLGMESLYSPLTNGNTVTRRDGSSSTALIPNTTTFAATNLAFLFLQPSTDSTTFCSSCTRNVMTSYITFMSNYPYAPGINNSLILQNEPGLYNSIQSTCGANFLSGAVQAAGGLSSGILSNDALHTLTHDLTVAIGAVFGAAAFAVASV
ncbi:hypothetical protein SCLCIDRAFT_1215694 [Scleroderma citrinum Foug A]|uniref:DUF7729 domain-containing protein n=1 Tax=Scleroderma citrinum Foug A TaxID=1036808 RepID=A0A0C3E1A4_9AGAM|nr:hypothetical protein SCLCIDRAFT_1215694 [Scleroderma citrinum Foug A]